MALLFLKKALPRLALYAALALVIPAVGFGLVDDVMVWAARRSAAGGAWDSAVEMLAAVARYRPSGNAADEAVYLMGRILEGRLPEAGRWIYVFQAAGRVAGPAERAVARPRALEAEPSPYERELFLAGCRQAYSRVLDDYPRRNMAKYALLGLARVAYEEGEEEQARAYLHRALGQLGGADLSMAVCLQASIDLEEGRPAEVIQAVDACLASGSGGMVATALRLKGDAHLELGRYAEAEEAYVAAMKELAGELKWLGAHRAQALVKPAEYGVARAKELQRGLEKVEMVRRPLETGAGSGIRGRVTAVGRPLAGLKVYLLPRKASFAFVGMEPGLPSTLTNFAGEFFLPVQTPGEYTVGIGLPVARLKSLSLKRPLYGEGSPYVSVEAGAQPVCNLEFVPSIELVHPTRGTVVTGDELRLSWVPYAGAASYAVYLDFVAPDSRGVERPVATCLLAKDVAGSEFSISLGELRAKRVGKSSGTDPLPAGWLGLAYPGGEFSWRVVGYDASGGVVADSAGFTSWAQPQELPVFGFPEAGMTEGDRALLRRDVAAARGHYEEQVRLSPRDVRSLRALAGILTWADGQADFVRAARLYETIYALTGDPGYLADVGDACFLARMYEKAAVAFDRLPVDRGDWSTDRKAACATMYGGDIRRAGELFARAVRRCEEGYRGYEPLKIAVLLGRDDEVERLTAREGLQAGSTFLSLLDEYRRQGYYAADGGVRKQVELGGREGGEIALAGLEPSAHRDFLRLLLLLTEAPGSAAKESFERDYARFKSQYGETAATLADLLFWFGVDHYSRQ